MGLCGKIGNTVILIMGANKRWKNKFVGVK